MDSNVPLPNELPVKPARRSYSEVVEVLANEYFHSYMQGDFRPNYNGGPLVRFIYDVSHDELEADVMKQVEVLKEREFSKGAKNEKV